MGYSLDGFAEMLGDRVRVDTHSRALREAITNDAVVLEIGTGTGYFALLAASLNARHVFAVESEDAVEVARELATVNGLGGQIEFVQGDSRAITLPQRVDVVFADLRGVLPAFQHHIPALIDARTRLLAKGGQLIPKRDTLWVAAVTSAERYEHYSRPWDSADAGFDTAPLRYLMLNTWAKARLKAGDLLTEPACWAELDYMTVASPDLAGSVTWRVEREGTVHGLCVWFDATLAEGITFSNAPGQPETVYGQAFFPLQEPVGLVRGDRVSVSLRADLVRDDYVWCWDTDVHTADASASSKASFRQSTFLGAPLSRRTLASLSQDTAPQLTHAGELARELLARFDGRTSVGQLAAELRTRFPSEFRTEAAALAHVRELVQQFARASP